MRTWRTNIHGQPIKTDWFLTEFVNATRLEPRFAPTVGIFDYPYACFKINRQWASHVLGALESLTQRDSWLGSAEQIDLAINSIELFSASLMTECEESDTCMLRQNPDNPCELQQSTDGGETWFTLFDFSQCAVPGPPGAPGPAGQDGQDGAPGQDGLTPEFQSYRGTEETVIEWRYIGESTWQPLATIPDGQDGAPGQVGPIGPQGLPGEPGQNCDCTKIVPPQPDIQDNDDGTACSVASGLATYLTEKFNVAMTTVDQLLDATNIIADLASGLIDAIPVIGAVVDAVVDFVTDVVAEAPDELKSVNDIDWREGVQCQLYCYLKTKPVIDDSAIQGAISELAAWSIVQPPKGPLLIIIGQIFAAWVLLFDQNDIKRRAIIYKDTAPNRSCEICDCDDDDPCVLIDFRLGQGGFERYLSGAGYFYGEWVSGTGWKTTAESTFQPGLLITRTLGAPVTATRVESLTLCQVTRSQAWSAQLLLNDTVVLNISLSAAHTAGVPVEAGVNFAATTFDQIKFNTTNKPDSLWAIQTLKFICS